MLFILLTARGRPMHMTNALLVRAIGHMHGDLYTYNLEHAACMHMYAYVPRPRTPTYIYTLRYMTYAYAAFELLLIHVPTAPRG